MQAPLAAPVPPQTLPQPLAILHARPEGDETGPETTYYILGTAHVSGARLGLQEMSAEGRLCLAAAAAAAATLLLLLKPHRCANPVLTLPNAPCAASAAESCEDVATLIRAVRPQVRHAAAVAAGLWVVGWLAAGPVRRA